MSDKKMVLRDNLSWMNSDIGLKNSQQLMDEYPIYEGQSIVMGVFHLQGYSPKVSVTELRAIGHLMQECYGLDDVYYLGDGSFLATQRAFQKDMFLSYARYVMDTLKDHEGICLHLSYITGCIVNENMLKLMYRTARQGISEKQEIVGTQLIDQLSLSHDVISYLYMTDHVDELTGLLVKKDFLTYGSRIIRDIRCLRSKMDAHIVYFNIVNFQLFNDRYGYGEGNTLLKRFGELLRRYFPEHLIARFEADHFYIMSDAADFKGIAAKIQKELAGLARNVYLEVRTGVAKVDVIEDVPLETYCDYAKMSVDLMKESYKSIGFYVDAYKQQEILKNYIVENFRTALEKEWIKLYFQPVIRVLNHELCSMEVLSRWEDPKYGLLAPDVFISTLEDYQLIYYLDTYVIQQACRILRENKRKGEPFFPISFNLSRLDLEKDDGAIFDFIEKCAMQYQIPKSYLNIEITESMIAQNPDFMKQMIAKFHEAGYSVWMDDFGSDYSSLNTLKEYDFDELKIDLKFLRGFNEKSRRIITAIVEMAKELHIQTLAEGVETQEQYDFLHQIGCEKAQGYLFSKPLPMGEVLEVLKDERVPIENVAYASYYDQIGQINLLSAHPLNNTEANYESEIALAVLEYKNDELHYLNANDAYIRMLKTLEVHSLAESEVALNDHQWDVSRHMHATARQMLKDENCSEEFFDFFDRDNYCIAMASRVAKENDQLACLVQLENISANSAFVREQKMKENVNLIYSLFDQVYLFDLDDGMSTTVYAHEHDQKKRKIRDLIAELNEHQVYHEDRQRFLKFFDLTTFNDRLMADEEGQLTTFIRLIHSDGSYRWCIVTAKNRTRMTSRQVMVTIAAFDLSHLRAFLSNDASMTGEALNAKLLWHTVMNADLGVFWKDRSGRYLGGNETFLTYFNLADASMLVGKNDADLGWVVNADTTAAERLVLEHGQPVSHQMIQVIVYGQMKRIVVSKQPIYDDSGRIVGLIGFFNDVEQDAALRTHLRELKNVDELTDTLNNEGFRTTINDFIESYELRQIDFGAALFSIDNLPEFIDGYGERMGEEMMHLVAQVLKDMFGFNSVIGHPELGYFVVLHQAHDDERFARDVETAVRHIQAIHTIGSVRYNIYISSSLTYYSEVEDFDKMKYLAKARLNTKSYDAPQMIAADVPQYTTREIIELMKEYTPLFDMVRLIEPDRSRATLLDAKGNLSVQPYCCYHVLGRTKRCDNCISERTVATRKNYTKVEEAPNGRYFAMSRFVVVDGREFSLEFVKKIDETPDPE